MTEQFNTTYLHDSGTSIFDRLQVPATAYSVSAHLFDDRLRPSAHRFGDPSSPAHTSCTPVFLDIIDQSYCINFDSCISTIIKNVDINDIYVLLIRSEEINDASLKQLVLFYFQYVEPCRTNNVSHKNTSWKLVIDKILYDPDLYDALLRYVFRVQSMTFRDYHAIVGNIVSEDAVRKYIKNKTYTNSEFHSESKDSPRRDNARIYIKSNIPQNQSITVFNEEIDESYHQSEQQYYEEEDDVEDLYTEDPFERGKMLFDKIKNECCPGIRDCYDIATNDNWNNEHHRETFITRIKECSENENDMYNFINKFISRMSDLREYWIYK